MRFLVTDLGVRQFLDIGTGIPAASNTHEVAQRAAPDSRIVYVDNDPVVLTHAQALLKSAPEGACDYIDADMRDPGMILAAAAGTLDFTRPVAVMLVGVLQFAGDEAEARGIIGQLMAACAPGSFLTISNPASDIDAEQFGEATRRFNEATPEAERMTLRDHAAVARFFDGLELAPPGLVRVAEWHPDSELEAGSPGALPAASKEAIKAMGQVLRSWHLANRSDKTLADLARMFNNVVQGWINYGRFYQSQLHPLLRRINDYLVRWACRKFKRLRRREKKARELLAATARRYPDLFAHWRFGVKPDGWTMGAV